LILKAALLLVSGAGTAASLSDWGIARILWLRWRLHLATADQIADYSKIAKRLNFRH
jgi:hypothetical protein